jgi:hypothetical protein
MVVVYSEEDKYFCVKIEWDKVNEYPKLKEAMERAVERPRVSNENEDDPNDGSEKVCIQHRPVTDSQTTLKLTQNELFYLYQWLNAREDRPQIIVRCNQLI